MMRIVIEIDGDNVQVQTDRQPRESDSSNVVDAGSAPMDLLRQHGEAAGLAGELPPRGEQRAVKPMKPGKDTPLNPLRAGQAAALALRDAGVGSDPESPEIVDGGGAPNLQKISRKANTSSVTGRKRNTKK
jgi:hypothetical protein